MSTIDDLPTSVEWLHEGTVEQMDADVSTAEAQFLVLDADREAFLQVVGGLPQQFTIGTTTYTRIVPLKYPRFDNCYAESVSLRGSGRSRAPGGDGPGIEYDFWIATVRFSTPAFRYDGDKPAVSESCDVGCDMITRPGTAYKFPSDNLIVPHPCGVPVTTIDFSLTFHGLSSVDIPFYSTLAGYVSSAEFYGLTAGKVLYLGPQSNGQKTVGNVTTFDVTHKFRYRSVPHNEIMRPDGTAFEAPVQVGDTSKKLLPTADLNALWGG